MPCHIVRERAAEHSVLRLRAHPLRIALVGQPNVGKSVVFGRLTGRYVTVSNYPGTTVAVTKGRALVGAEVCDVIDTPGVNTLDGVVSEDERITRDVIAGAESDVIVQVADARNIRRALMLTAQLADYGKPMVLALNMVDEAFARGVSVDAKALAAELRVPVTEMVAIEGRGFSELRGALACAARHSDHRRDGEGLRRAFELGRFSRTRKNAARIGRKDHGRTGEGHQDALGDAEAGSWRLRGRDHDAGRFRQNAQGWHRTLP
jgi:small GTP-binding protein